MSSAYHIGVPGQEWGAAERQQWRSERTKSRSYADEVVAALEPLRSSPSFDVVEYGRLDYDGGAIDHRLYAVKSKAWDSKKPAVLVTGGVHGYETSGVHGALRFLTGGEAEKYAALANILVSIAQHPPIPSPSPRQLLTLPLPLIPFKGDTLRVTLGLRAHSTLDQRGSGPEP